MVNIVGRVTAVGRFALRTARASVSAIEALPTIADVLTQLRDAAAHVERLTTFAAQELPEVVYQLEAIRDQLAAIESRLDTATTGNDGVNGVAVSPPASRRND